MKKFILAAGLAMPLFALSQQKATAGNECFDLPRWLRYRLCTCLHDKQVALFGDRLGGGGCANGHCGNGGWGNGGWGSGSCGMCDRAGGCCGCNLFGCNSRVPGPWYLYWPYNGYTQEIAGYGPAWPTAWNYEMHFRTASPWGMPVVSNGFGTWAFPGPPPAVPPPPPPVAPVFPAVSAGSATVVVP